MKTVYFINYLIVLFIQQVNGSFLSRMKNRYEYMPLPIKEFNTQDMDGTFDTSSPTFISSTLTRYPMISDDVKHTDMLQMLSRSKVIINSTLLNSKITTAIQKSKSDRGIITTEAIYYDYEQDKWPAIKLLVALTSTLFRQTLSTSKPSKRRKRTWPSYFPPKFVSKLQAELDEALLPWKSTTAILRNTSTNDVANKTEETDDDARLRDQEPAYCFECGLDVQGIPRMPGCYHVFENDDFRTRQMQRRFKVKCIKSSQKKKAKNKYYGPDYIGGCFKRFLDVGVEYNERGCRTKEPTRGKSYASKRLARLERMLKDIDDGCVFSPYASLTPFSRAISLYARYHVCVCNTRYCNQARRILPLNLNNFISLTLYFLI